MRCESFTFENFKQRPFKGNHGDKVVRDELDLDASDLELSGGR